MYRKNTAGQFIGFVGINASTGADQTGTTGFAAYLVIDGGAQGAATGTVTDKGNGQFSFALSQADTNGNDISIKFGISGMVSVEKTFVTTACDPTNAASFGITDLDATVSSRSTYAGADTGGTTTLLARIPGAIPANGSGFTAIGDARLTNLDAAVSSRSTLTGPSGFSSLVIAGGGVSLNLAQLAGTPRALDAIADSALTVGDAMFSAICGAAGKESISGTVYLVSTPSTGTVIRTFTLGASALAASRS